MSGFDDWLDEEPAPESITKVWAGAVKVPTTDEMDGIFTAEDKANKNKVMLQCTKCNEWTQNEAWKPPVPCTGCGAKQYDPTSATSLRTFNPTTKRVAKGYKKKR